MVAQLKSENIRKGNTAKRGRKLSEGQRLDIARRYVAGESSTTLSREFGVGISMIVGSVREAGLLVRSLSEARPNRKICCDQWPEIEQLYLAGKWPEEIGEIFGVHKSSIRYILKQRGVRFRNKGTRQQPLAKLTDSQKSQLCERYQNGEHLRPLAEEYGTNQKGLTTYLKRQGVEIRPSQAAVNAMLAREGKLGKTMSCKIRGIPLKDFDGFTKPERARFMVTTAYKNWRKAVFGRDGYKCRLCGCVKGGSFHAHHILPYAKCEKGRICVENGITLCRSCHENLKGKEYECAANFQFIVAMCNRT